MYIYVNIFKRIIDIEKKFNNLCVKQFKLKSYLSHYTKFI
jgi:hypothetical protein